MARLITLAQTIAALETYEKIRVHRRLMNKVWLSIGVDCVLVIGVWMTPFVISPVTLQSFFFNPMGLTPWLPRMFNQILASLLALSPYILCVCVVGIIFGLLVLALTWFNSQAVDEPLHWLAAVTSFLGALTLLGSMSLGAVVLAPIALAVFIWLVLFLVIAVCAWIAAGLLFAKSH
jgi:fluoride ion exporter CrcB/FEX